MRLIDVDEALNIIAKYCPDDDGSCSCAGNDLRELLDEIEAMPTIDAEPVKHGRWIIHREEIFEPNRSECYMSRPLPTECSVCGFAEMRASRFAFCPNCGARMDGDNND